MNQLTVWDGTGYEFTALLSQEKESEASGQGLCKYALAL